MVDSIQGNTPAAPFDPRGGAPKVATEANGTLGKESFMQLLVAQLSNQDPMSPTDPTEFVSQLSQFSQLEQLIGVQEGLELIAITQTAGTSAQMVSFIGKEVEFEGSGLVVAEGDQRLPVQIELADAATEATLTITDDKGAVVEQIELGEMTEGEHSYYVDVEKYDLDPGKYNLSVTATDIDGGKVASQLQGRGEVTAVTFESGFPELVLADGRRLSLSQILQVIDNEAALPPEHVPSAPLPPESGTTSGDDAAEPSAGASLPATHKRSPDEPTRLFRPSDPQP